MKVRIFLLASWLLIAGIWLVYLLDAPFHEDEAIYAAWGLRILGGDVWLWETPVDKPPLTFYPMALTVALFGRHEWAARLPNLFWMLLLLASLWRIARRRGACGWFVVGLSLLSPLTWTYAASAFTDVAMVALAFLALERQLADEAGQAGIAFGLALLAKPTAILLVPLLLVAGPCPLTPPAPLSPRERGETLIAFIMACAAPLLMAWAWDASRAAPSWWVLGAQAYGTLGSLSSNLLSWGRLLLIGVGPVFVIGGVLRWKKQPRERIQDSIIQLALALTLLLWLPAHILLGFQPWERYLFPLVPIAALLLTPHDRASDRARIFRKKRIGNPFISENPCSTSDPLISENPCSTSYPFISENPCSTSYPLFSLNPCSTSYPLISRHASVALNPCSTSYPLISRHASVALNPCSIFLLALIIPALIVPFHIEPHDGRWEGIAEIGATIEELPPNATVYYLDVGRPLAWYAADAEATLQWVGTGWERVPDLLTQNPDSPHYVILRRTVPLPNEVADWTLIKENSSFRLLYLDLSR